MFYPAAASGTGHCPATPTHNPQRILRIRRNQPLQFMAADFAFYPAAASGSRPCRPAASGSGHCPAMPTHNPQRILRIRRNQPLQTMAADFVFCPAAAGGCRLSLPAAGGSRPCRPACPVSTPHSGICVSFRTVNPWIKVLFVRGLGRGFSQKSRLPNVSLGITSPSRDRRAWCSPGRWARCRS